MRRISASTPLAVAVAGILTTQLFPATNAGTRQISLAELEDKIRGGWAGQMIGVAYGAPTEFKACGELGLWELSWSPERVENAIHQDDLYVEMTFSRVMDTLGVDASSAQYGEAFKNSQYHLWHANAAARRALNRGIKAPLSGHPRYNIHANDIDFQIEADFIGLMCPGLPREVVRLANRVGRVMNYGDGVYGGMFVGGMYAAAYLDDNPRRIVEAGLECLPPQSGYAKVIRDVLRWSTEIPADWRAVWRKLQEKWDKDDPCPDGALAPFNIDARLNGAYIAIGLLFGERDFGKTMEISTRCGQDSDCNPSSAAGVLGVMLGYSRVPETYRAGIPKLADKKFDFTEYSFNDICKSTLTRAISVIRRNGGRVTDTAVIIPLQTPKPPRLEQWDPGIPDRRIAVQDPNWTWTGQWRRDKEAMVATGARCEAILHFDGVAVVLLGQLNQQGGQADVFVDRQRPSRADAYIVKRTHDNALWHVYGLKPGHHTLRLVTTGHADPRSGGTTVALQGAVVYRGR